MSNPLERTRWDDLRVFLAVLRAGSFSGAAELLGVEQSTISRRIASLESELGLMLFDRQPSGPRPTEVAAQMRAHAERAEAEILAIGDLAAGQHAAIEGRVRLALTESFASHVFIPHMLAQLRSLYPRLNVDLLSGTRAADLAQREADIALRFFRPTEGDLVTQRITRLPTAIIAQRAYAAARPNDPEALDWIVLDLGGAQSSDAAYVAAHVRRPPSMLTNSHLLQVDAVRAGHGVALLARAHLALDPELICLELGLPPAPAVDVWLAAPRTLKAIPRVTALWDFLAESLRGLGSEQ